MDRMDRARAGTIGNAVERIEDLRFLRGKGEYLDDLARDRLLHAVILRSPVAHGRIVGIDAGSALAIPGVHAVLTARDVGAPVPIIPMRLDPLPELERFVQPVIAETRVRYVGEPLAVVVAESVAIAEDALDAIVVDIEALPVVADREAAESAATLLFESAGTNRALTLSAHRGDVDAAFRDAPYVRRERFAVHRHSAMPLESRGLLAEWDAVRGKMVVHGAGKVPFANRRYLARAMGLPEADVEMIENDVGGGFGVRGEFYPEDFLVPFAARRLGRPVKWVEDRREHFLATNHARDVVCDLEIACERDGTIRGLRGRAAADIGAYVRTNGVTPSRNVAQLSAGPYRIEHLHYEVALLLTNKTPVGTYRGPGRFETDFFRERLLDMVAADLGIDRVELRRRNLVRASDMPWPLATLEPYKGETSCDSGDYAETLDRCLAEFDWAGKSRLDGRLVDGRWHGIAVGCYIEGGASGPREGARIALEADGRFAVYVGSSAVGQGLETVMTQIAADALGVPLERIRGVFHGSTTLVKEGFGAYSSRCVVMGGSAVMAVAQSLKDAIRAAAAAQLDLPPGELEVIGERVVARDGRTLQLAAVAERAGGIEAEGSFASTKRTYSYGAHAAHVAVDAATGRVEVLDYVAVEDVGRIINPLTLHGQTTGAIVQGLGGVFLEHLVYDEAAQLVTASFADYLLPTATDFPVIRTVALENHPSPNNPLGAKGAGEGGIIPVGGVIANAVAAALRTHGVQPRALPLSPARVWALVRAGADAAPSPPDRRPA
jgi:carbon-monoxide dehydrogenase large subunit